MEKLYAFQPYLTPFYTLQYPAATPPNPDSFHDSHYYNVGQLDICIIISCIAVMAILRDAFRLGVFEPLARWKLFRDLAKKQKLKVDTANGKTNGATNGHVANGNGHSNGNAVKTPTARELRQLNRKVLRFAEQGWSFIYYSIQWSYGLVCPCTFFAPGPDPDPILYILVCALPPPNTDIESDGFMARIPSHTYRWPRQVLLSNSNCFLSAPNLNH
jgi:hypothetical protein